MIGVARAHTRWWLLAALLLLVMPPRAAAQTPEWVEPQALNIVDIAGQVPDEVLRDAILTFSSAGGLARFVSSEVEGELLRITVRIDTRRFPDGMGGWYTQFTTLGQRAHGDHMASIVPGGWVRVFDGDTELTEDIRWMLYWAAELKQPETDASAPNRYPELEREIIERVDERLPLEEHGRRLPANMGGELALSGDIPVVTAIYTFERPTATTTQYLGTQHTDFPSYIAPPDGGAGLLRPVVEQIYARYGDEVGGIRHPRIPLDPPAAANYVLFSYPPLLMDAYDQSRNNIERPSPGTIRLAPDEGMLSTDLVQGGAFPLRAVWQDADQSAGPEYLSLLPPVDRLTPPEFYVPPGIPFDPCFVEGGCSDALLQRIYDTRTPLDIIYLRVDPDRQQTIAVPLRMADDPRYPAFAAAAFAPGPAQADGLHRLYLPLAFNPPNPGGTGSPVGLFEPSTGRMVGYTR
ncbi:MAG: hypothetical protein GX649_11370 [Chloroflexi bacterium]|nr:hypothetical protein [Chloroflexota bacterium]